MRSPDPSFRTVDLVGLLVWVVSIVGESIADRQLERFRTTPGNESRVCTTGLWRYSRHPNYFFEWLHWLAYVPIAYGNAPLWAILLAPVILLLSIRFITGIPPIERRSVERRGDDAIAATSAPPAPSFPGSPGVTSEPVRCTGPLRIRGRRVGKGTGLCPSGRDTEPVAWTPSATSPPSRPWTMARFVPVPSLPAPRAAKEQHYEVPAAFFEQVLGPWRKYSSCLWPEDNPDFTLADAELAMLELTCARAGLADRQDILDLGCGWGALTLYAAERYPASRIVAVSHSGSQRRYIEARAKRRRLANIRVITGDISDLDLKHEGFDRVVSVEMFEHMNNLERLVKRITSWMRPHARLFVHVFCHHARAYRFSRQGRGDWMAREFFTGGLMPSPSLIPSVRGRLVARGRLVRPRHALRAYCGSLARESGCRAGPGGIHLCGYLWSRLRRPPGAALADVFPRRRRDLRLP